MKKEQWIEEVMSSMQGIQRAESNPYLHTRVLASLDKRGSKPVAGWKPVVALCTALVLIVCLNIFSWNNNAAEDTASSGSGSEKEYELITLNY